MEKFRDKYRIPSTRWASWDYASNAAYFVTICTANRAHDFGRILDGKMQLTSIGQAATDCWHEIPAHFPFVLLDGFAVMPNHVHGIIVISKPIDCKEAEMQNLASLQDGRPQNKYRPQSKNLASIVRGYKIGVTKFARQHGIPFSWQARFHDHVIRNQAEYERIARYILENPIKWADDRYYICDDPDLL
jgi:putative transposase